MSAPMSRRQFIAISAAVSAGAPLARVLGAQAGAAAPQAPAWKPVFTPVRRNVEFFTGRGGTIGYLINSGGIAVVDSQYPDAAKVFLDGLNARTHARPVDVLLNTHHHADHTGGNPVFVGVAKTIVAQAKVPALQKEANDKATPPVPQAYADHTFGDEWHRAIGDETIRARTFTPAHTGGDIVVHFEKANVVHVGDLVWNGLQTFVDRPGGASAVNWIAVCERIAKTYPTDAVYLCGHAAANLTVSVTHADVLAMRDYLTALVDYVRKGIKAGDSRDAVVTSVERLPGFEARGPLTKRALEGTYDELIAG